ncbi:COQ9 family protein [Psychromarinibacter sp. C21-152]|uniref:COQ9 family protein n=1 Tax=Psychromarinibacter sediminicola TaxID=3033385 RepID=A0AAE3NRM8_9RHOB|nr:COQ9 family protein [Psychromarinibacter sediminicola]MDF0600751.1 COQ9 family protein [Psychromarinibacter sediminicola]
MQTTERAAGPDAEQAGAETDPDPRSRLLRAAMPHVAFDGWSETTFRAASEDAGLHPEEARAACPRGALDLAVAFHKAGDAEMLRRIAAAELGDLRFRDRIAFAVRARIEAIEDREAVRRGSAFFSLPQNAPEGARLIWETADAIWTALGDPSDDINWYTKRATLSGVYGATVLFWLGDDSDGFADTWAFLDRRIEDVMRIETVKARVRDNPVLSRVMAGPNRLLSRIRAPARDRVDMPGRWGP